MSGIDWQNESWIRLLWIPIVVAVIAGIIILTLEYRSPFFRRNPGAEVLTPLPTIFANLFTQEVVVRAGNTEYLFDGELTISVTNQNSDWPWRSVYFGPDIQAVIVSTRHSIQETMREGDCVFVEPFAVNLADVSFVRDRQEARFLGTRLAEDANLESCQIYPFEE
jgi:hypothetical protein